MIAMASKKREAFSLSEILIATVLLVLAAVPVMAIFSGSKQSIDRADERREKRYFLNELVAKAQRHSLQTLWDAFGPYFVGAAQCGYMRDRVAEVDSNGKLITGGGGGGGPQPNPLGLTQDFLDDMRYAGYEARMRFEFYPRDLLGVKSAGANPDQYNPKGKDIVGPFGLLHMQAGYLLLSIRSLKDHDDKLDWRIPMMCPAIVGRPGLKMEGCPALDTDKRVAYGQRILSREAEWSNQPPLFPD